MAIRHDNDGATCVRETISNTGSGSGSASRLYLNLDQRIRITPKVFVVLVPSLSISTISRKNNYPYVKSNRDNSEQRQRFHSLLRACNKPFIAYS